MHEIRGNRHAIPKSHFQGCFQQWQKRWTPCIYSDGDYSEQKKKPITKIRAYFVDSVRKVLNTPWYAWNLQGHKHCTDAQCDKKTHKHPTTQNITNRWNRDGDRPVVGGAPPLYSVWLTSLTPLRVQNLEDEQKRFVRLGETCPSAFIFHHFRCPHNIYPTSPLHSIGQHAMRIKKSATRYSWSTWVPSMIMKLHFLNSITRVLPVICFTNSHVRPVQLAGDRHITATITGKWAAFIRNWRKKQHIHRIPL